MRKLLKKVLRPTILIPIVLSIAILAALLSFGDIPHVVSLMVNFPRLYLLFFLLLMAGYETVRCIEWHFILKSLRVPVPLRAQIFAFMVGEVAKVLPIGNYFDSFLLSRAPDEDFGRLSSASTLIVLNEVAVCLVGVVIFGVGSWTPWLRPLVIVGVLGVAAVIWIILHTHGHLHAPAWMTRRKGFRNALGEIKQFRTGVADLIQPRTLALTFGLTAIYLVIAGAALYLVTRGLGAQHASFWGVLGVYFFSLGFSLIFPLPIDIGVVEVSGTGAFLAEGISRGIAVSAMLINRVLSFGSAVAIALVCIVILRREFQELLLGRGKGKQDAGGRPPHDGSARPPKREPVRGATTSVQTSSPSGDKEPSPTSRR